MLLQEIRVRVSHVNQFKSIFNCDFISAGEVVHQKLNQVEEISGFETGLIEDAAFVHESKFVFIDLSVKIFIDFPDPLVNLRFVVWETEFGKDADHIFFIDGETE